MVQGMPNLIYFRECTCKVRWKHAQLLCCDENDMEPKCFETVTLLSYLEHNQKNRLGSENIAVTIKGECAVDRVDLSKVSIGMRSVFLGDHHVASVDWFLDVRRSRGRQCKLHYRSYSPKRTRHLARESSKANCSQLPD